LQTQNRFQPHGELSIVEAAIISTKSNQSI